MRFQLWICLLIIPLMLVIARLFCPPGFGLVNLAPSGPLLVYTSGRRGFAIKNRESHTLRPTSFPLLPPYGAMAWNWDSIPPDSLEISY
jgi:hypothetical protein